ncbi:hypothetical protein [Curtobacterium sp. MCPF17_021]|jgi:hypothetical protein|uniref:hypothetical protein n=1 Tax=Curtobacterium sp. MCPF17_021 TaxID=2175639 RepID=UPI0011B7FC3F|nr:hypothetical protein [Curtobacterium sp. MCPF17_021]WIE83847.1 hypothetical protein DEJ29_003085 [Curtobacterium sp. MCPF17_021]
MTGTVLLTATVRPNTTMYLVQHDPVARLEQYRHAISTWATQLEGTTFDLTVVETSGATATELLSAVDSGLRHRIRTIQYDPSESDASRGKGRLEADAIARGVAAVEQDSGPDQSIYKSTGRLVLRNARRLVRPIPLDAVRVRMTLDRSFADTRFVGAHAQAWRTVLLADTAAIDEEAGIYFEHVVAGSVARSAALQQIRIERFPERPHFAGQSGSTGRRYRGGLTSAVPALPLLAERGLARLASRKQT